MEIFGVKFSVNLGAWKLRFLVAIDDETPDVVVTTRDVKYGQHVHLHSQRAH